MNKNLFVDENKYILFIKYTSEALGTVIKRIYFTSIKEAEDYIENINKNNIIYFGEYKPIQVKTRLEV